MRSLENFSDLGNEFSILTSQIAGLCAIAFEVINFDGRILPFPVDMVLNGFPLSDADSALATSLKKFPVEIFMLFLFGTE